MNIETYARVIRHSIKEITEWFDEVKIHRHTSPEEMEELARIVYSVSRRPGVILECGCCQGYSSACLSVACSLVGKQLIVADSFCGLPGFAEDDGYNAGQFSGSFYDVRRHVRLVGVPHVVSYVSGFYADTLPHWRKNVAMLWLDVDLYQSTLDVIEHVHKKLHGPIMSHEFMPEYIDYGRLTDKGPVTRALSEYMKRVRQPYFAEYRLGSMARIDLLPRNNQTS